jgi:hypothetical protein
VYSGKRERFKAIASDQLELWTLKSYQKSTDLPHTPAEHRSEFPQGSETPLKINTLQLQPNLSNFKR